MSPFKKLLKISRPRFWMYIFGPALLGFISGSFQISFLNIFILIVFLIPANIFIYGINDYHDFDTDHFNDKKGDKEHKLLEKEKNWLKNILNIAFLILLIPFFLDYSLNQKLIYILFLFLGWAYSSPPFRFKAKPFLDSFSNLFYILPAFFFNFSISPIFFLWPIAMHLYSAIPDIEPDKKANLKTTATVLDYKKSLLLCFILWGTFSIYLILQNPIFLLSLVYPTIPAYLYFNKDKKQSEKIYWYFPKLNITLGFLAFWFIVITTS